MNTCKRKKVHTKAINLLFNLIHSPHPLPPPLLHVISHLNEFPVAMTLHSTALWHISWEELLGLVFSIFCTYMICPYHPHLQHPPPPSHSAFSPQLISSTDSKIISSAAHHTYAPKWVCRLIYCHSSIQCMHDGLIGRDEKLSHVSHLKCVITSKKGWSWDIPSCEQQRVSRVWWYISISFCFVDIVVYYPWVWTGGGRESGRHEVSSKESLALGGKESNRSSCDDDGSGILAHLSGIQLNMLFD